jgi:hypothetical protein
LPAQAEDLDPNFDRCDALLKATHPALLSALQSNPIVRTPQDAKALIDAANNAIIYSAPVALLSWLAWRRTEVAV